MSSKPSVLVVDDCETTLLLLRKLFEEAGAEVQTANSGKQALGIATDCAFGLVILDICMPEMRGPEVATKLRETGFKGKIVALTATASGAGRDESRDAGIDVYLSKRSIKKAVVAALTAQIGPG